ncbi:MAG: hypothetical protein RIS47_396, partial [Bacteroidota bacterium]
TAGLNLVRYIREEIDNKFIRVVLWTGQPGHAPEKEVIAQYEINDYRTKTELTADKLFTVVLSALRNYTSLLEIESFRQHLEEKVQSRTQELELQKQVLLRQSIDLQKALNIKDHFLRIISHDLKNPLAAILSISNTLIHNPEGEREETRDGLNHIKLSADHLLKLLQNLLDWLKAQRESLNFQPENTTLYPLLCDTVGLYRTAADYKKIEIICEIDRQTQVIADKNMLATLLRNLISNAIKYSFPNGTITIGIFEHDSEIEIYVRDTGIGISHADIETILNSLQVFSHEGTQKEKGTGIGLFICKQLLEAHHSSLHIISTPNQGSQFSFLLPKTNIKKE